jgi:hypothetical protein
LPLSRSFLRRRLAYRYQDDSPRIVADKTIAVASWTLHPGDGIQATAVGNGALELRAAEIAAVHRALIKMPPPRLHAIAGVTLPDMAAQLGYDLPPYPDLPATDLHRFLVAEMLLPAADVFPRPPWWFQERMVECRPISGEGVSVNRVPRPIRGHRIFLFRARVLLKAIVCRSIVRTKSRVKRLMWPLAKYLPLRPPQPPKTVARFWLDVSACYNQYYKVGFTAAYLMKFGVRRNRP